MPFLLAILHQIDDSISGLEPPRRPSRTGFSEAMLLRASALLGTIPRAVGASSGIRTRALLRDRETTVPDRSVEARAVGERFELSVPFDTSVFETGGLAHAQSYQAAREGFEPPGRLRVLRFSRPPSYPLDHLARCTDQLCSKFLLVPTSMQYA